MKEQDFIDAGFKPLDDPQFKFEYDLSENTNSEEPSDENPAILWDNEKGSFCVTDGNIMFIYFQAETPVAAIEWANNITLFEVN